MAIGTCSAERGCKRDYKTQGQTWGTAGIDFRNRGRGGWLCHACVIQNDEEEMGKWKTDDGSGNMGVCFYLCLIWNKRKIAKRIYTGSHVSNWCLCVQDPHLIVLFENTVVADPMIVCNSKGCEITPALCIVISTPSSSWQWSFVLVKRQKQLECLLMTTGKLRPIYIWNSSRH